MAKIGRRRLAREVVRMIYERPNDRAVIMQQLAAYLVETKQTNQTDLIIKDIADELFVQQSHLSATVRHALPLSTEILVNITDLLKKVTGANTVELQTSHDEAVLGGVIIRTPRQELDASVRAKLKAFSAKGIQ